MTPKGKQDYVRRIIERAREFMESSRKKKKKFENERARERKREGGSGIKWKVKKKKEKKGEDGILWVYMCGGQNAREKKKKNGKGNIWLKERQSIRNHNLKLLQQFAN